MSGLAGSGAASSPAGVWLSLSLPEVGILCRYPYPMPHPRLQNTTDCIAKLQNVFRYLLLYHSFSIDEHKLALLRFFLPSSRKRSAVIGDRLQVGSTSFTRMHQTSEDYLPSPPQAPFGVMDNSLHESESVLYTYNLSGLPSCDSISVNRSSDCKETWLSPSSSNKIRSESEMATSFKLPHVPVSLSLIHDFTTSVSTFIDLNHLYCSRLLHIKSFKCDFAVHFSQQRDMFYCKRVQQRHDTSAHANNK